MDGCQLTGACSSYARKYALNALLMIDDSKDSDDDSLSPKNPANQEEEFTPPAPSKGQVEKVGNLPKNEVNPVFEYINNEKEYMRKLLGCNKAELNVKFKGYRASLISGGVVEDIPADKLTMEQAKNLIEAIYDNFFGDKKDEVNDRAV